MAKIAGLSAEQKTAVLGTKNADGLTAMDIILAEEKKAAGGLNQELVDKQLKTLAKLKSIICWNKHN